MTDREMAPYIAAFFFVILFVAAIIVGAPPTKPPTNVKVSGLVTTVGFGTVPVEIMFEQYHRKNVERKH